jgi:hypothetical protein
LSPHPTARYAELIRAQANTTVILAPYWRRRFGRKGSSSRLSAHMRWATSAAGPHPANYEHSVQAGERHPTPAGD